MLDLRMKLSTGLAYVYLPLTMECGMFRTSLLQILKSSTVIQTALYLP